MKLNEGSRWIRLPIVNMTFQTSDLAKLALIMYISRLLSRKQDQIKDFKKGFLPVILPVAVVCMLIAPANLSTALLIGATCMMLMFIGRVSGKHLLLTIGIAMIPVMILILAAVIRHKSEEPSSVIRHPSTQFAFVRARGYLDQPGGEFHVWNKDR